MRSQGVKKPRARRATRGGQNKRPGLHSTQVSFPDTDQTGVSSQVALQEQGQLDSPAAPAWQPRKSWQDTLAALDKEPLANQIQRYRQWKRDGSHHEDYCRVCFKSERLEPCLTCRLAFHVDCIPAGWLRNSQNQLFCAVCVQRGWHTAPPALTPPASPKMGEADGGPTATTSTAEISTSVRPSPHLSTTPSSRQLGASPIRGQRFDDPQALPAPEVTLVAPLNNNGTSENDHSNTPLGSSQPATRRPRKSRYMSLPSEVDASLNVLYRELESNATLRLENEELRDENARHLQTIRIRDLSLMALRRELDNRRFSDQEYQTLRENAVRLENANKEIQELRARNEALEAELQISKEAGAEAKALVDDWKGKLSQLLNN